MTRGEKQQLRTGLLFISPWMIGFVVFSLYPLINLIYNSFCDYSVLLPAVFIGGENYATLATDQVFWKAMYNTLFFAAFSIPLGMFISVSLAILLNFEIFGRGIFRTIFFLPSLVPTVAMAVLWRWMLNGDLGLINNTLRPVLDFVGRLTGHHLEAPSWLEDARYAKWGLIMTTLWGVGNAMVIYLAGLQEVPRHLYESADIDGANFWQKTLHVTLPIISPTIYFNTIMAIIGTFQVFAAPYILTGGGDGPRRSLLFIATYLYQNAFDYWNMGYACAIGVVLFLIILTLTLLATRLSQKHIHYEGK